MPLYVDKDGSKLTRKVWEELQANTEYMVLKDYLNELFRVRVIWHGTIIDVDTPREHWAPFRLEVWNLALDEKQQRRLPVKDVDATEDFRTAVEAIRAYEDFLVRYAGCEWLPTDSKDEDGQPKTIFLEKGNKLAPLSKDVPIVDPDASPEVEDIYGSW